MARGDYKSPEPFRTALEQRIRLVARGGNIGRIRQLLVFDRFFARVFRYYGERVALKGVLVLELRLARARTTRDVQDELPWRTLADVHVAASSFLDPVLAGANGVWDHQDWNWR